MSEGDNVAAGRRSYQTARLVLRAPVQNDAGVLSALMTPAVSRWLASWPVPFTPAMASGRIARARTAADSNAALSFVIDRRSDGTLLGWIAVTRDAADNWRGMLGYWLGEACHGSGIMREAAPVVVAAAFELLGLKVIEAAAQPENAASFAIMRGCGMVQVGERMVFAPARGRHELCHLYKVARSVHQRTR